MEKIPIDNFGQFNKRRISLRPTLRALAVLGLALNALALAFAWSDSLIKIETDAMLRLPFGLSIPLMREQNSFSLFGGLREFYENGQTVVFAIIAVFGVAVPIAKLAVSALVVICL